MAGQAAADARADVAERQVDLVVHDEHALERRACSAPRAGPTERPASFMYVCGSRTATRGPPGPVRPSVSRPANFVFARGSSQRAASALATSKPTLCGVPA